MRPPPWRTLTLGSSAGQPRCGAWLHNQRPEILRAPVHHHVVGAVGVALCTKDLQNVLFTQVHDLVELLEDWLGKGPRSLASAFGDALRGLEDAREGELTLLSHPAGRESLVSAAAAELVHVRLKSMKGRDEAKVNVGHHLRCLLEVVPLVLDHELELRQHDVGHQRDRDLPHVVSLLIILKVRQRQHQISRNLGPRQELQSALQKRQGEVGDLWDAAGVRLHPRGVVQPPLRFLSPALRSRRHRPQLPRGSSLQIAATHSVLSVCRAAA